MQLDHLLLYQTDIPMCAADGKISFRVLIKFMFVCNIYYYKMGVGYES
jgi:hypothetical protein